jgi:hypothetical protein
VSVADRFQPEIFGVACLGYGSSKNRNYRRWISMIARCYDPSNNSYHNYGAIGVRVCDRWLRFDNFLKDLPSIEGYSHQVYIEGMLELDKDIKQLDKPKGERIYSLETCMLVTRSENDTYRGK